VLLQGAAAGHRVVRHGVVFGAFMTWNMLGAQLCKRLLASSGGTQPETLVGGVIVASGCALLLPVFTTEFSVRIGGFCIFEAAIGAYWPLIMKLRSDHLGEEQRAAVTSLFRVPTAWCAWCFCVQVRRRCPVPCPWPRIHTRTLGRPAKDRAQPLPDLCAGVLSLGEEFSLCVCFLGVALVCQQMVSRALQSPLSPAATKRRALAAGRSPAKPMETLLLPVPSVRPRPPINCASADSLTPAVRRARSANRGKPLGRGRAPGSNERMSAITC